MRLHLRRRDEIKELADALQLYHDWHKKHSGKATYFVAALREAMEKAQAALAKLNGGK